MFRSAAEAQLGGRAQVEGRGPRRRGRRGTRVVKVGRACTIARGGRAGRERSLNLALDPSVDALSPRAIVTSASFPPRRMEPDRRDDPPSVCVRVLACYSGKRSTLARAPALERRPSTRRTRSPAHSCPARAQERGRQTRLVSALVHQTRERRRGLGDAPLLLPDKVRRSIDRRRDEARARIGQ